MTLRTIPVAAELLGFVAAGQPEALMRWDEKDGRRVLTEHQEKDDASDFLWTAYVMPTSGERPGPPAPVPPGHGHWHRWPDGAGRGSARCGLRGSADVRERVGVPVLCGSDRGEARCGADRSHVVGAAVGRQRVPRHADRAPSPRTSAGEAVGRGRSRLGGRHRWRAGQQDSASLVGWCRVVEATHSPSNGWHLHVHALMCWAGEVSDTEAQRIAMRAWARWDRALCRREFDSTPARGVDARRVRFGGDGADDALGSYFTKIACEVTAQHAKDSRSGRSPFAILRDAVETYRAEDLELWWEWERASHGRKQLTWSLGRRDLRVLAGVRDRSDDEIAAEDVGTKDVIALTGDAWDAIARGSHETELLDLAETEGIFAVTAWLDARGLGWVIVQTTRLRRRAPLTYREGAKCRAIHGLRGVLASHDQMLRARRRQVLG